MALYYNFAFAAKEEQPIWMVKLLVEGMKQQLRFLYPGGRGYPRKQAESKAFTCLSNNLGFRAPIPEVVGTERIDTSKTPVITATRGERAVLYYNFASEELVWIVKTRLRVPGWSDQWQLRFLYNGTWRKRKVQAKAVACLLENVEGGLKEDMIRVVGTEKSYFVDIRQDEEDQLP